MCIYVCIRSVNSRNAVAMSINLLFQNIWRDTFQLSNFKALANKDFVYFWQQKAGTPQVLKYEWELSLGENKISHTCSCKTLPVELSTFLTSVTLHLQTAEPTGLTTLWCLCASCKAVINEQKMKLFVENNAVPSFTWAIWWEQTKLGPVVCSDSGHA